MQIIKTIKHRVDKWINRHYLERELAQPAFDSLQLFKRISYTKSDECYYMYLLHGLKGPTNFHIPVYPAQVFNLTTWQAFEQGLVHLMRTIRFNLGPSASLNISDRDDYDPHLVECAWNYTQDITIQQVCEDLLERLRLLDDQCTVDYNYVNPGFCKHSRSIPFYWVPSIPNKFVNIQTKTLTGAEYILEFRYTNCVYPVRLMHYKGLGYNELKLTALVNPRLTDEFSLGDGPDNYVVTIKKNYIAECEALNLIPSR